MNYEGCMLCDTAESHHRGLTGWSNRILSYAITGQFPGLPLSAALETFDAAFNAWENVCDIKVSRAERDEQIDISVAVGRIDGGGGTLAWSEMPDGRDRQLQQRYERGEMWTLEVPPSPQRVNLLYVAEHEIGHALGLHHMSTGNRMQPAYSGKIATLQPEEIAAAVSIYGEPQRKPVPVPPGDLVSVTMPRQLFDLLTKVEMKS